MSIILFKPFAPPGSETLPAPTLVGFAPPAKLRENQPLAALALLN
jgi:hypothetical protein